jgi:hypothetical protein
MMYADRVEQPGKRESDVAQVNLIVANADVVIAVTVDDEDFRRLAELIKLSGGANGGPQASETGTKDEYARHPLLRRFRWIVRPQRQHVDPESTSPRGFQTL